ncbi:hypothetical protein Y032_0082g1575 [Ancylostoma ceylanicum]|uniref:Uncharacterized protein n=1 Tax=Ancylostoma ceylanicum TaxID=53326 RepID=A0A016TSQ1_9BILA|nr:hypothetical protein Y032_0082g1575 [Ancylostoma ceylanicum]
MRRLLWRPPGNFRSPLAALRKPRAELHVRVCPSVRTRLVPYYLLLNFVAARCAAEQPGSSTMNTKGKYGSVQRRPSMGQFLRQFAANIIPIANPRLRLVSGFNIETMVAQARMGSSA